MSERDDGGVGLMVKALVVVGLLQLLGLYIVFGLQHLLPFGPTLSLIIGGLMGLFAVLSFGFAIWYAIRGRRG